MSRTLKIFLILFSIILLTFNFSFVQATSNEEQPQQEDQALTQNDEDNSSNENSTNSTNNDSSEVVNETSSSSLSTLSPSSVTSVSNVNSYEEANLQLNNILSIILIAIGVLLILFAIAILIKLKR